MVTNDDAVGVESQMWLANLDQNVGPEVLVLRARPTSTAPVPSTSPLFVSLEKAPEEARSDNLVFSKSQLGSSRKFHSRLRDRPQLIRKFSGVVAPQWHFQIFVGGCKGRDSPAWQQIGNLTGPLD